MKTTPGNKDRRPTLLDLFCGAGGAGEGYRRAGFDVTGVDIKPQPRNPHKFIEGDALEYLEAHGNEYDAIHASPPCQASSALRHCTKKRYECFIGATREKLKAYEPKPWVIENVVGAPLNNPAMLCGCAFGLSVETDTGKRWLRRHRLFESNIFLWSSQCLCFGRPIIGVYGNGDGGGRGWKGKFRDRKSVMGIDWMNRNELSQAIPPAYTEFIGGQMMKTLFMFREYTDEREQG